MTLRLYDTASRSIRDFVPVKPGHVSIYLCGATPQTYPHIGHVRSGVAFDILRRWFLAKGNDVAFVRNITDIDDKILTKAAENGRPWWEWVFTFEREFTKAYDMLGVLPPSAEPRATGHVTQMVEYIQRIIDEGYAYPADGNVYFNLAKWSKDPKGDYGCLSGQKIEDMEEGDSAGTGKRSPLDFALWKVAKPGEPSWPTPWGPGRPGWHIECSVMSTTYLGSEFDIHCGGLDLQFPHHENEIAQAHGAGDGFAHYWLHNGWVTLSGEKMSKSLGNTLSIPNMLEKVRPVELRYYLGSANYRSMLEYSEEALQEAATGYRRIEDFLHRIVTRTGSEPEKTMWTDVFENALDDDLGVPAALAEIHTQVRAGNAALESGDQNRARDIAGTVRAMADVLGIDPLSDQWRDADNSANAKAMDALDVLVGAELERRAEARAEKNWAVADDVRDRLNEAGIAITDTAAGPEWSLQEEN